MGLIVTLERHAVLDSTNRRARELARAGAPHGTCVVADRQTEGRGQRGRSWDSPLGGGLYVSLVLRPRLAPRALPLVVLAAAVASRHALARVAGLDVGIKWPNDLLSRLDRRKLGGMLLESGSVGEQLSELVLGIGLNLAEQPRPPDLARYASSVEAETGSAPAAADVLDALDEALVGPLAALEAGRHRDVIDAWIEGALGVDEAVEVLTPTGPVRGVLRGLDEDAALRLDTPSGPRVVRVGELHLAGAPPRPPNESIDTPEFGC